MGHCVCGREERFQEHVDKQVEDTSINVVEDKEELLWLAVAQGVIKKGRVGSQEMSRNIEILVLDSDGDGVGEVTALM